MKIIEISETLDVDVLYIECDKDLNPVKNIQNDAIESIFNKFIIIKKLRKNKHKN